MKEKPNPSKEGIFGKVPLSTDEFLASILTKDGKLTGYITGNTAHNRLFLTTQISNEYVIATKRIRKPIRKGL